MLCWICSLTRCWILYDIDHIEASCIFYVEVGTLNGLEQNKICIMTITALGIAMLTVQDDMMFSVCCMYDLRDFLRQTSADVHSVRECTFVIPQRQDLSRCSPWFISVIYHTLASNRLGIYHRTVGNPCNRQLCATGFMFCRMSKLTVTRAILTWRSL